MIARRAVGEVGEGGLASSGSCQHAPWLKPSQVALRCMKSWVCEALIGGVCPGWPETLWAVWIQGLACRGC